MSTYTPRIAKTDPKLYDTVAEQIPYLWNLCYPRRYREVGGASYDTPKAVARCMFDALLNYHGAYAKGGMPGQTEQTEAVWASLMAKYRVPTYYLAHDIAVALNHTTPVKTFDWPNMHLPFDAAAFVLPTGILTHPEYGDVSFVAYSRIPPNCGEIDCPCPTAKQKHTLVVPPGRNTFSIFIRTTNCITLHWTYTPDMGEIDLKDEAELEELQQNYSHTTAMFDGPWQNFTATDIATMTRAIKLVFNVIMLLTAKPELVERAYLVKKVRKGPGSMIEFWMPHVIGRTYKLRYERGPATGTHASPIGHWVSGFVRDQPHGPKHSLRKEIWIEPYWRGGEIQ